MSAVRIVPRRRMLTPVSSNAMARKIERNQEKEKKFLASQRKAPRNPSPQSIHGNRRLLLHLPRQ